MKKLSVVFVPCLLIIFCCSLLSGNKSVHKPILGGVVPHHLLADFIIADFFKRLSVQKPHNVILIGPNHDEKGGRILSSLQDWQTSFGLLEASGNLIVNLKTKGLIELNEEIVRSEHAIADIIPFIRFYLPDAKIVPIVLRQNENLGQLQALAKELSKYIDEKTIMVASIDFSHFLSSEEAETKDEETLKAISGFEIRKILSLKNENLDSPASLIVLLLSMRSKNKNQYKIIKHTNSGEIIKDGRPPVTSYFSLAFY